MKVLIIIIEIFLFIPTIIAFWKVFNKAGRPGWACIIPFYNIYILIKIAGRPGWWLLLFCIPIFNLIIHLFVCIDIANNFERSTLFGVGLFLLPFIFYPILAFGDAKFTG